MNAFDKFFYWLNGDLEFMEQMEKERQEEIRTLALSFSMANESLRQSGKKEIPVQDLFNAIGRVQR